MAISYELMDLDAGSLVGSYRSLDDALTIIRQTLSTHGRKFVDDLVLFRVDGNQQALVAEGAELARQASERRVA